jgi:hypothetical protein
VSRRKHLQIPELTDKQLKNFHAKIDKRGPDDCWEWLAGKVTGYGSVMIHPFGMHLATRIMYYLATGKQPGSLCTCHTCDNPGCCNPAHLFLGTNADNVADKVAKGRAHGLKGVNHGRVKLTEAQVHAIRASNATGVALAAKYDITEATISRIRLRQRWKHI